VVSAHWHGKDATKDMPAGYKITFRKDRTIVEFKGSEGGVGDDSRVKLNPSKSPKELEWSFTLNLSTGSRDVHARLELPGIYEIEGDTLKLCWDVGRATGRRPTGFKTETGTEHLALVLKRAKSGK
jgi:uncharacterized protein (TIGR03067 family)